ncbi:MAG: prepilin-type N-terminal cleavage/methylation domain-containing protein [Candidatus Pacebacteria bacterium]|nr:prepilin-type N-terminal cleavage/methylation domain-containing protein [Candidatus Paceibacterota bacterium]
MKTKLFKNKNKFSAGFTPSETVWFFKFLKIFNIVNFRKYKKNKIKFQSGFSLIELLVTISILFIVSGFVYFNHAQFNNHVLIENLAYEISLVIRQAQSYGVQVKQAGGSFYNAYGVYFNKDSDELIVFADMNSNFVYDAGVDSQIDVLRMIDGNHLSNLNVSGTSGMNSVNISFLRPNPEAIIKVNASDFEYGTASGYSTAEITIKSPKGIEKTVFVNNVGQISVQAGGDGL